MRIFFIIRRPLLDFEVTDSVSILDPKLRVEAGRRMASANGACGAGNVIGLLCSGGLAGYMSFGSG